MPDDAEATRLDLDSDLDNLRDHRGICLGGNDSRFDDFASATWIIAYLKSYHLEHSLRVCLDVFFDRSMNLTTIWSCCVFRRNKMRPTGCEGLLFVLLTKRLKLKGTGSDVGRVITDCLSTQILERNCLGDSVILGDRIFSIGRWYRGSDDGTG